MDRLLKLLLQLSLRNLLRHKRRNGMLLLAITVAVAGVNASNTLLRGYQYDMLDSAVNNLTGHVKVHAPGYLEDPTIGRAFVLPEHYTPDLPGPVLQGWAQRLRIPAVIMSERETRGVQLVGIEPAAEGISFLTDVTLSGESLHDAEDPRILVGDELLRQLRTQVGRRLVILTQGADGLNRERGFRIAGSFDAQGTGLEKMFAFVGLAQLQRMLDTNAVTEISFRLTDEGFREPARQLLTSAFADLEVLDWHQLEPQLAEMFLFADSMIFIWFLLMMSALTFGLVNALVAAVMERIRELGMLRALGMRKRTVVAQVVIESSLIMATGVLAGTVTGWMVYAWIADGIDLSTWSQGMELIGVSSFLMPVLLPGDLWNVAWMSMVLGVVSSLYPAWRAVQIKPLTALRSQ